MKKIVKVSELPYERGDVKRVERAFIAFKESAEKATCAQNILDARKVFLDEIVEFTTNSSLAYTRYSLNTRDEFYVKEQEYYDEVGPMLSGYISDYSKIMLASPFRKELEELLPETLFPGYECAVKAHDEIIVEDEQEENNIVTEYSQLMAQLTTDWEGEQKTISYIRGFMEDGDRGLRKKAAEAVGRALASVSDKLDDIYDRLVKVRTRMAQKLGYKNYIELGYYRMNRIDYNRDMVEKFRKNVLEDIVPVVSSLKKSIADRMGVDKLAFYDNEVTESAEQPVPYPDAKGILDAAREMYHEMSPITGAFIDKMLETEAFDTESRDGKWGGGYATTFAKYKQEFILANFNGSSADVDVVTHEYGHTLAFHYALEEGDVETDVGSMETAETHSMSMEFFAWPYMDKFFKDPDLYKYKHLASALSFIPYGVIVDEFQHIVYENPDMTPAERNQAYLDLEKKYRPYLSFEGIPYLEMGTRWQYQMHIYESPFYYIDYCLAQVVALEFLADMQKDYDDALNRYFAHAKRGGKYPFSKLVSLAGLKSPFEEGSLKEVASSVLKIIDKVRK